MILSAVGKFSLKFFVYGKDMTYFSHFFVLLLQAFQATPDDEKQSFYFIVVENKI
jgi:hypothetical protein